MGVVVGLVKLRTNCGSCVKRNGRICMVGWLSMVFLCTYKHAIEIVKIYALKAERYEHVVGVRGSCRSQERMRAIASVSEMR